MSDGPDARCMSDTETPEARTDPSPVVKHAAAVESTAVDAGEGMSRAVLLDDADGAPNFAMRRFTLAPGATVPEHTNEVEHEQYVLSGEYTVTFEPEGDAERHRVSTGSTMLIPAGVVHSYHNDGDEEAAFICVVPHGDDTIRVLDE